LVVTIDGRTLENQRTDGTAIAARTFLTVVDVPRRHARDRGPSRPVRRSKGQHPQSIAGRNSQPWVNAGYATAEARRVEYLVKRNLRRGM